MNNLTRCGLGLMLSSYAILGFAVTTDSDPNPLTFLDIPFVGTVNVGDVFDIEYRIKNKVSTASLPIFPSFSPNTGITRTSIGVGDDCGPNGSLLKPLEECTLTYTVTVPNTTGVATQTLSIDYESRQGYILTHTLEYTVASSVYVTNGGDGSVFKCPIITSGTSAGLFGACVSAGTTGASSAVNIAFGTFNNHAYAYIADFNNSVTQCDVNSGLLSGCGTPGATPPASYGIALNTSDNTYAYISGGYDNPLVYKCDISALNGNISNCNNSGIPFSKGPTFFDFQSFQGNTYAYIGNGDAPSSGGSITRCKVLANGDFESPCANYPLNSAIQAAFANVGGQEFAYVTQWSLGQVSKCAVNPDGSFGTCTPLAPSFGEPVGIVTKTVAGKLYAYVVDGGFSGGVNQVMRCTIDSSGDFVDPCVAASPMVFNSPFGITLH